MPRPIQARSAWHRPATDRRLMSLGSCSRMTGVSMVHVPYRGAGAALPDLLAGQVQVMFPTMSASIEYVRTGKLRALAVTTVMRYEALPDLPTVAEFVPGYEASYWAGLGAPKNTPADIVHKLHKDINHG